MTTCRNNHFKQKRLKDLMTRQPDIDQADAALNETIIRPIKSLRGYGKDIMQTGIVVYEVHQHMTDMGRPVVSDEKTQRLKK
ncbi:hypothetical protein KIN20_015429 [Parelaphostrongylus tenuis]|uniref:Uncharacterized protein n=1 Tax=Parelaphostrongylus tenuis TaxID=148309 RepID=A0AAD5MJI2_PARTN|nr:hypothetical protein KIN20_015429 [Parelaphostrongylus tenuis]